LFALINSWILLYEIESIKSKEPLLIFESTKDKFKKFFISVLTNDEKASDK
jgi:hypothetical protein